MKSLQRLRYFVTVADELHFGRAAERLHMSQPPLSQQIQVLETEVGFALFDRSSRRVVLTDEGQALYPEAKRLLNQSHAFDQMASALERGLAGRIRVGFVDSAAYRVMPNLLRNLRQQRPRVEFELTTLTSDLQVKALLSGEIDIGLARAIPPGTTLSAQSIHEETLVCALSTDHELSTRDAVSITELRDEPLIGFNRMKSPSLHAEMAALFAARDLQYDPGIEATEYTTILGLVAAGQGMALVPESLRVFRPPGLRYVDVSDEDATSRIMLVARSLEASPLTRSVVEAASSYLGGNPE